jgi:hypothetical protein
MAEPPHNPLCGVQEFEARRALDSDLKPYRGKMIADQLAMLEQNSPTVGYWNQKGLPRLSLFYP